MILRLQNRTEFKLSKGYVVVGNSHDCDLKVDGESLCFALQRKDNSFHIVPASKTWVNGRRIKNPTMLADCDRIEWEGGIAIFLEQVGAKTISRVHDREFSLDELLAKWISATGSDEALFVVEREEAGDWMVAGSFPKTHFHKNVFSHTILNEAIKSQLPVVIESLSHHPWAGSESLIGSKIVSVAAIPLSRKGRVVGCLYTTTRTPGKFLEVNRLQQTFESYAAHLLLFVMETRSDYEHDKQKIVPFEGIIYHPESPMKKAIERVVRLSKTDLSILIRGETGTGKELIARAIHAKSDRSSGPFVAINCGAIPASLMESTLFGHEKGAFTGATRQNTGKIREAHKGTLFLDEVADLPVELQVKLLRVLQEKKVEPLGSDRVFDVDFRILSATHQNVEEQVKNGTFREDLFYRLQGADIQLPPLRDRKIDIPLLIENCLSKDSKAISMSAMDLCRNYPWPGNVRQLIQVVARASAMSESVIDGEHLELEAPFEKRDFVPQFDALKASITEKAVNEALSKSQGSRKKAAFSLGISERTLYRWISRLTSDKSV